MRQHVARLFVIGMTFVATPALQAQSSVENWPERPITLIAPAPPAGSTDTIVRALADGLSAHLGQPVVVENRPGATGTIAFQATLRAPDDGYTFVLGYPSMVISTQFTVKDLPFNAKRDFQGVVGVAFGELVMNVNAALPITNPQELVNWIKNNANTAAYGSYGQGTYGHVAGHYLSTKVEVNATHVPYKGEQPLLMAVASNDVAYGLTSLSPGKTMQDTGKTRMIGLLGAERSALAPDLPTFKEAGMPDPALQLLAWYGFLARKTVPEGITKKMEAAVLHVLNDPKIKERYATLSVRLWGATGKTFEDTWYSEIPVYYNLLRLADVELYARPE